jgi:SAM-dependent methyltransferase
MARKAPYIRIYVFSGACPIDIDTIGAYDAGAADYAADWEDGQPPPDDLYAALTEYFRPGPTADIGCGSGRDTAWLAANGYDAVGIDASQGLLDEAARRHPGIGFLKDALPALPTLPDGAFANVLCETVIMHLPPAEAAAAARRLSTLLAPDGTLYLSWRVTSGQDVRDKAGRLYAAFDTALVRDALGDADRALKLLLDEEIVSASSGRVVHRLVVRKG